MRHDQTRKTGTNAKEKGGTRRQKLAKADQRGKDQKASSESINTVASGDTT